MDLQMCVSPLLLKSKVFVKTKTYEALSVSSFLQPPVTWVEIFS